MSLLITRIGIEFDKLILKIYAKTKLNILKSYLQKRVNFHQLSIIKLSKEIIDSGNEENKKELFKTLKDIIN
ncbi:hypothetical protein [Clostridium botulinum]|uniref:hypothetical protein n=1 Tax=Clostridium botulinum TaxID=1491 RepID=UPI000773B7FA|nr:hypothetical protein [Clostridium botulinum]NFL39660.1 hypothetical protein [Clostridium botulinum]NFL66498.1 hypothetical protein [Clostridium botulinum]NFN09554.1 hypothetical protein [Clostridium botulinum]NFN26185.1 hypothetical protein [Clostridium botulinum]NFN33116.1 hypothetical protein [Clostridium botulinum]